MKMEKEFLIFLASNLGRRQGLGNEVENLIHI
jgi:hypothetical protein